MEKIPSDMTGGANAAKNQSRPEKYKDAVGIDAGDKFPGGSADAKGTDRGFHPARQASEHNPQNTHEQVSPDYTRKVGYGGKTEFPDAEP